MGEVVNIALGQFGPLASLKLLFFTLCFRRRPLRRDTLPDRASMVCFLPPRPLIAPDSLLLGHFLGDNITVRARDTPEFPQAWVLDVLVIGCAHHVSPAATI